MRDAAHAQHLRSGSHPPSLRRVAVLGSTGSLGNQALDLCRRFGDRVRVVALGASGRNAALLLRQARAFRPALVAVPDPGQARRLQAELGAGPTEVIGGPDALVQAAVHPEVDLALVLTVGLAGLEPTLRALEAGKRVALANKEVLVAAGELLESAHRVRRGQLLPVDSEHSAIWQSLWGEPEGAVERLWLTASGGPFWGWPAERLAAVTPQQALNHPTWRMGPRVTVDSATLMNKGFEVIEAHHLFGVPYERIRVVVHRQSVVHSVLEFCDGSYKAQLSLPDMRIPLLVAMSFPERWALPTEPLFRPASGDGTRGPLALTFELPADEPRSVRLARQAAEAGGTYPAVLAAADEAAVQAFLGGRLRFDRLLDVVEAVLQEHEPPGGVLHVEQVREADRWAREAAERITEGLVSGGAE